VLENFGGERIVTMIPKIKFSGSKQSNMMLKILKTFSITFTARLLTATTAAFKWVWSLGSGVGRGTK